MSYSKPKIIDLFSGVGGLSLGAERAGFDVSLAVELDAHAVNSHAINFPRTTHWQKDIGEITGKQLLNRIGASGIEGIIGGPPCQGFSSMGKRDINDPRNALYSHFYRIVSEVQPEFFIAENVPGILSEKNKPILNAALSMVQDNYEIIGPLTLKASDLGAATTRKRVFVIGLRNNIRWTSRAATDLADVGKMPATNVGMALYGLPEFVEANSKSERYGTWEKLSERGSGWFYSKLYGEIPEHVGDQDSISRLTEENEVSGCIGTVHQNLVVARFRGLMPGRQDRVSKATRLDGRGLCPTLRAGTGSERGSYQAVRPIHPTQPRVITPREAARLQGFPDWFQFHPTKWHSFRQIGNSVCPLVSEHILACVKHNF